MQTFFYPYTYYCFHWSCLMLIPLSSTSAVSISYMVLQQLEKKLCCQVSTGIAQTHVAESQNTDAMKTFYLSIVLFHWLYTCFNWDQ